MTTGALRGLVLLAVEVVAIVVLALTGNPGWAILVGVFAFLVVTPAVLLADYRPS